MLLKVMGDLVTQSKLPFPHIYCTFNIPDRKMVLIFTWHYFSLDWLRTSITFAEIYLFSRWLFFGNHFADYVPFPPSVHTQFPWQNVLICITLLTVGCVLILFIFVTICKLMFILHMSITNILKMLGSGALNKTTCRIVGTVHDSVHEPH